MSLPEVTQGSVLAPDTSSAFRLQTQEELTAFGLFCDQHWRERQGQEYISQGDEELGVFSHVSDASTDRDQRSSVLG